MTTYTDRDQAVITEIIEPIQAVGTVADAYESYDIDAIENEVLDTNENGYACKVSTDEFWKIVEKHAR